MVVLGLSAGVVTAMLGIVLVVTLIVKNVNWFLYEAKLGAKKRSLLPPGDLGLPFVGNMWSFLSAYKSPNPETFINSFYSRYGKTGMYKSLMFGSPGIIVTTPELSRKILTDDENFKLGWPRSTIELVGEKSFIAMGDEDHKRLRRLTSASINGLEPLSMYLAFMDELMKNELEKWSKMGQIELLTELRRLTFKIIIHIFLGASSTSVMEALEKEYTKLNYGMRALRIDLPGFAFHKAFKARKNLVSIFQNVVNERRKEKLENPNKTAKDMLDQLIDAEDENGRKLADDEVIDIMIMYLNAGHESSGHTTMWATLILQQHPQYFQKAKQEQEEIVKRRPPNQKGMTMKEYRQMDFLSKAIDETMRYITFSLMTFREAKRDVKLNGFLIPKGWKVFVWYRAIHQDPQVYPNPRIFDPSRFDSPRKAGEFLPFGLGTRLCPGNELAKLEITVFLHHFLLNYKLEHTNPNAPIMFLPHTRPVDNCLARVVRLTPYSN
ncbi:ent-kaurenoic acid oxidase 2 [Arachis duranensis]|uniref:Ent-kaurenoic acid oxidase 2 n=1 Tax=Arachis duranensis TaxID=130453 RepID=A0A6P4CVW1_ARADU|nr:ent-kaurenoic acid oxidase 2 [Arachis duranensis]